ncbi:methyltransferase [Bacillus sp. NPDC077027]|uniref:methyltransferase n=1 Tax=Bacillus sp. NPDC077027 TaxID=3390548 RepID=UPI003CFEA121
MFFNKKQIDKLLDHNEEENENLKNKIDTSFMIVFYFSILLSICTFFFDYKYFLITLFGPTVLVTLINPPFQQQKGLYRLFAALYLVLLMAATYFWVQK